MSAKTINGIALASVKTFGGTAIANVKTIGGVDVEGALQSIPFDVIVNFSDGTVSSPLTGTNINNGTHGASWGTWHEFHGVLDGSNTHSFVEDHDVNFPVDLDVGGTLYAGPTGTQGKGLTFDFTSEPTEHDVFRLILSATVSDCITLSLVRYNTVLPDPPVSYNCDMTTDNGSNYTIPQYSHTFTDTKIINCHSEGDNGNAIPLTEQWLAVWSYHDVTNQMGHAFVQEVIQDGSDWIFGDFLGATQSEHGDPASTTIYKNIQSYLRPAGGGTGNIKIKLVAYRNSDLSFPPLAVTIPAPASVTATQTDVNEVTVTWAETNCQIFKLERNKNSAGWTTLEANYNNNGVDEYVDTDLVDTDVVEYRVTTIVVDATSAETTSAPETVDNGPFATPVWSDATDGVLTDSREQFGAAMRQSLTCGTTGSCVKLRMWCKVWNAATDVKMGLYDSSNNLLGSGIATAVTTTSESWIEVTLSAPVSVTASTTYKIGVMPNPTASKIQVGYDAGAGTCLYDFSTTYASFPPNPYSGADSFSATVAVGMGVI